MEYIEYWLYLPTSTNKLLLKIVCDYMEQGFVKYMLNMWNYYPKQNQHFFLILILKSLHNRIYLITLPRPTPAYLNWIKTTYVQYHLNREILGCRKFNDYFAFKLYNLKDKQEC